MTIEEFLRSANDPSVAPPSEMGPTLRALWCERQGNWDKAHEIAQNDKTAQGSWVHAYLHRKDGEMANAAYWYNQAGRPVANGSHDEEWNSIVRTLLS